MHFFAGRTSQRRSVQVLFDAGRKHVTALRFSIVYRCERGGPLNLRAVVVRAAEPWKLEDSDGRGFSDWFGGPAGRAFHITGTLSRTGSTLTGTLHSLLTGTRRGPCDSGHLRFRMSPSRGAFRLPRPSQITSRQYRRLRNGTSLGVVLKRFGPPTDRETFTPRGVIEENLPQGVPGSFEQCLNYEPPWV